jgi:hypothetical protein
MAEDPTPEVHHALFDLHRLLQRSMARNHAGPVYLDSSNLLKCLHVHPLVLLETKTG